MTVLTAKLAEKLPFVIITLVMSALLSCSGNENSQKAEVSKPPSESSANAEAQSPNGTNKKSLSEPTPVLIALVTKPSLESILNSRTFTASTRGLREARLDTKRPGRIVSVNVVLGESVMAGQTLVILDSALERFAVDAASARRESAEAGKEKAERDWKRAQELFAESGISQSRLESVRLAAQIALATYDGAVAELGLARRQLSETRVVAPFDGEVSSLPFEVGETPPRGALVAEITDRKRLIADIFLSEEEVQLISVGMTAEIGASGATSNPRTGVLRALSPRGNETTKLFKGEVVIDNQDLLLRAGGTCRVTFRLKAPDYPLVPLSAIIEPDGKDGRSFVAVVTEDSVREDGAPGAIVLRASLRNVVLGERIGSGVSIVSGLEFGERIVVKGAQALSDNQPIRSLKEAPLDSLLH